MTQSPEPTTQPTSPPNRPWWKRIAGPRIPEQFKNWAMAVPVKLGEYYLLTIFLSLLVLLWFVGFAQDTAGKPHWEYWWSVLTGNYQPASEKLRENEFLEWEYGASLVLALLINIAPLIGVILFVPRYVKMLIQLQEQPVKLNALLDMVDGLVKSELLTEFGQSDEVKSKIKSAFIRVKARRPEYVNEVFGQNAGDISHLLNKELTG